MRSLVGIQSFRLFFQKDATNVLKEALISSDGLPAATEIVGNYASFDNRAVADALIDYFSANDRLLQYERRLQSEASSQYAPRITRHLASDRRRTSRRIGSNRLPRTREYLTQAVGVLHVETLESFAVIVA